MKTRLVQIAFIGSLCFSFLSPKNVDADLIVGASDISSPQGEYGGYYPLSNIINQSGLSSNYSSGVTDFASFTSSATTPGLTGTGFTGIESTGPQQFTFDFGEAVTVDAIAIWNTSSVGAIDRFSLYMDDDIDFTNGTTGKLLNPTELLTYSGNQSAQVFNFSPTTSRYIHFNGLSTLQSPDYYGLSEVAFSMTDTPNNVPEPGTLYLILIGLIIPCRLLIKTSS